MKHVLWSAVVGVGAAFASCGGCGGVGIDDFPAQAAKVRCERVYACCAASETADAGSDGPDQASCVTRYTQQFASRTDTLKSEQSQGRLAYHADLAATCLQKYSQLTCQELKSSATDTPAECQTYLEAKTAAGGACVDDASCIGGRCLTGTCVAYAAEGGGCNDGGICAPGDYCAGTCVAQKADGQSCGNNFECKTGGCNDKPADGGAGTCGVKGGAGTTCFLTHGCSVGGGELALLGLLALTASLRRRRN